MPDVFAAFGVPAPGAASTAPPWWQSPALWAFAALLAIVLFAEV